MKQNFIFLLLFVYSNHHTLNAQSNINEFKSEEYALSLGYGNMGFNGKFDVAFMHYLKDQSSSRFYLDFSYQPMSFSVSSFNFNHQNYSSDAFLFSFGGGIMQEFLIAKRLIISPFIGARYYYVRFTDGDLVDAIGTNTLVRYTDFTYSKTAGPVVENGYGNTFGFEAGTVVGIKIIKWLEVYGSFSFAPVEFSTANTLFGKYWGESPYPNNYYVDKLPLRMGGGLRFSFGG